MKIFLPALLLLSFPAFAAQQNCVEDELTHFVGDLPEGSYEWYFAEVDAGHTRVKLTFATEINDAVFFQALAQSEDDGDVLYAFPLEVLDHPITTEAKEVEFIVSNEQLAEIEINIIYLEQPYLVCRGKKSFSYYVRAS